MLGDDPRLTLHKPTVQALPPTSCNPKKRLSHATKFPASASAYSPGAFVPIVRRAVIRWRKR